MADLPMVFGDEEVSRVTPDFAVATMREAILAHGQGMVEAPPRVPLGIGRSVVTVGAFADGPAGLRVHRGGTTFDPQVTVAWNEGRIAVIVVGSLLAERRTGAIGAVATDLLGPPEADTLGLVGSGRQAMAHVWALRAVRPIRLVRAFSRDRQRLESFARRVETELDVECLVTESPEAAAEGAPLVTLATSSGDPVIDPGAIWSEAHVTSIGPKTLARHEMPIALAQRAMAIATDAPEQLKNAGSPHLLSGVEPSVQISPLSSFSPDTFERKGMTIFISAGLGGTEVALAVAIAISIDS